VQALVYCKRDNGREAAAIMIRQVIKLLFDFAIHEQAATINPATWWQRATSDARESAPAP
jgi:hypothetical protein